MTPISAHSTPAPPWHHERWGSGMIYSGSYFTLHSRSDLLFHSGSELIIRPDKKKLHHRATMYVGTHYRKDPTRVPDGFSWSGMILPDPASSIWVPGPVGSGSAMLDTVHECLGSFFEGRWKRETMGVRKEPNVLDRGDRGLLTIWTCSFEKKSYFRFRSLQQNE